MKWLKNLLDKLLYLTSLVNEQDEWRMTHPSGIVVHRMFVSRGLPYACPFCDEEIKLLVDSKEIVLGYQGKIKLNKIKFTNCQKDKKLIKILLKKRTHELYRTFQYHRRSKTEEQTSTSNTD